MQALHPSGWSAFVWTLVLTAQRRHPINFIDKTSCESTEEVKGIYLLFKNTYRRILKTRRWTNE